jgi:hypothetical protein
MALINLHLAHLVEGQAFKTFFPRPARQERLGEGALGYSKRALKLGPLTADLAPKSAAPGRPMNIGSGVP